MGSDEPNENDEAGELHAEIVRMKARELRADQRRMASIYDARGWSPARICGSLDIDLDTLARLLAVDGRILCTECAFGRHLFCDLFYADAAQTTSCECYCRSATPQSRLRTDTPS